MEEPMVQIVAAQAMSAEGPRSALMRPSVLAGRTQPRYAQMLARHCAYKSDESDVFQYRSELEEKRRWDGDINRDTYHDRADELRTTEVARRHRLKLTSNSLRVNEIDCPISMDDLCPAAVILEDLHHFGALQMLSVW